jgi:hypothetical protein
LARLARGAGGIVVFTAGAAKELTQLAVCQRRVPLGARDVHVHGFGCH